MRTAGSTRDSIETLQYQVLALDAMLVVCEQAHVDSLVAKKTQEAKRDKEYKKALRKEKGKGRRQGFVFGVILTTILFIL